MRRISAAILAALFAVGLCRAGLVRGAPPSCQGRPQGRLRRRARGCRHGRLPRRRRTPPRSSRGTTRPTSSSSTRPTRRGRPSRTRSRAPRSSSTWATATAGRAPIATTSTRRPRTASGSTRRPAATTRRTSTSARRRSRSQIKLAKNAVVLLNHLCYASGNSEPGLPEGTLDQAQPAGRQLRRRLHQGRRRRRSSPRRRRARRTSSRRSSAAAGRSRRAWRTAPSANGHRLAFASTRSPGYVAQMDTETATSGFTRSIVMKAGLAPADVRAGAAGSASGRGARTAARSRP